MAIGIPTAISIAVTLLSVGYTLLRKKKLPQSSEDIPKTTATRGSFIPLVIGKGEVGATVIWIQPEPATFNAEAFSDSLIGGTPSQGKGQGGRAPQSYSENALHALCVGPADRLDKIKQNGRTIFEGPITPASHPSGSRVIVPNEGSFLIYWGFTDDPPVALIGAASNHGIDTKYPLVTKILWNEKNLGTTRQWGRLTYEVTCPCHSGLVGTSSIIPESFDDSLSGGDTWRTWIETRHLPFPLPAGAALDDKPNLAILYIKTSGPLSARRVLVVGDPTYISVTFPQPNYNLVITPGSIVKVFGNQDTILGSGSSQTLNPLFFPSIADATGEYLHVFQSSYNSNYYLEYGVNDWRESAILPAGFPGRFLQGFTEVTVGPRSTWEVNYRRSEIAAQTPKLSLPAVFNSSGVNIAHAISQVIFAPWPYGAARNRNDFDIKSLEQAARFFLFDEPYKAGIVAEDGETAESVADSLLGIAGMMVSFEPSLGKYIFVVARHGGYLGEGNLPELPESSVLSPAEIGASQPGQQSDRHLFTFKDRTRNYRDEVILVTDDGVTHREDALKIQKSSIVGTFDFDTAVLVAARQAQEAQSAAVPIRLNLVGPARMLWPGAKFACPAALEGDRIPLICMAVVRSTQSEKVEVTVVPDVYDPPRPIGLGDSSQVRTGEPSSGGLPQKGEVPAQDLSILIVEPNKYISKAPKLIILRSRASKTPLVNVWMSRDGSSYIKVGIIGNIAVGATLVSPLGDEGVSSLTEVTADNPFDVLSLDDLTASPLSFYSGRQVVFIGSEICYLESATPTSSLDWTFTKLLRGRLGTRIQVHPVGTRVFIAKSHLTTAVESTFLIPGRDVWVKVADERVSLDAVTPVVQRIAGNGLRPLPVCGVRLSGFRQAHAPGEDVVVHWNHLSAARPRTGLGMQGFGDPCGTSPLEGVIEIRIRKVGSPSVLHFSSTTSNTFTFTVALRASLAIVDGLDSWSIELTNNDSGFISSPTMATFYST